MVGKEKVEAEVSKEKGKVSRSAGRTNWKIICSKNRTRCGATAYYYQTIMQIIVSQIN